MKLAEVFHTSIINPTGGPKKPLTFVTLGDERTPRNAYTLLQPSLVILEKTAKGLVISS